MTITAEQLVAREIRVCVSSLVAALASAWYVDHVNPDMDDLHEQAQELSFPIDDYAEAAREWGWSVNEEGRWQRPDKHVPDNFQFADSAVQACEFDGIEPHQWDVYEHWAISEWLAGKLTEQGEKVDTDFAGLCVWARTTTGQTIAMDAVMQRIYAELTGA